MRSSEHPGVDVVYIHPADLAGEAGDAQRHVRKAFLRQKRAERVGHHGDMHKQRVCLPARDYLLCRAAGVGFVRAAQLEGIATTAERLLHAGEYLKHVRVFKGNVAVKVGEQHDPVRCAARKALGAGVRVVLERAHRLAHAPGRGRRNAVVPVYDL